jgi:hypothetical protein
MVPREPTNLANPASSSIPLSFCVDVVDRSAIDWQKDVLGAQVLILEINEGNFHSEYIPAFLSDLLQYLRKTSAA